MAKRFDDARALFRTLLREVSEGLLRGFSAAEAFALAPSIEDFAKGADRLGILRVFRVRVGEEIAPLAALSPQQLGANLVQFFERYRNENGGDPHFDEAAFEAFWTAGSDEIMNYRVEFTRFVGLTNIDVLGVSHQLCGGVILRSFDVEVDSGWANAFGALSPLLRIRSVLEICYAMRLDHQGMQSGHLVTAHDQFHVAVALQQGAAPAEALVVDRNEGIRMGGSMIKQEGTYPWGRPLSITQNEALEIANLMRRLEAETREKTERSQRIARAAAAYRSAILRRADMIGEQLVDAWMALESLFGEHRETTSALAFRIPAFVEHDASKRRDLANTIRSDYEKRSLYVHGGRIHHRELPAQRAIELAGKALKRILEDPSPYPHAPREIEARFMETGTL